MGISDRWMVRPGTLFMLVLIGGLGLALFSWASTHITKAGNSTIEDQTTTISCSELSVNKVDSTTNSTHHTVFLTVNQDVDNLLITFNGSSSVVKAVENPSKRQVLEVTAPIKRLESVKVIVDPCSRAYDLS